MTLEPKLTLIPTNKDTVISSSAPSMFTGSGYGYYTLPLSSILNYFRKDVHEDTRFEVGVQLSLLLDKHMGRTLSSEPLPEYLRLYHRWSAKPNLRIKDALPSLLPSALIMSDPDIKDESGKKISIRAAIRQSHTFWSHSGIIGLDIDLKKKEEDTNPEDPVELQRIAKDKLPYVPGYLFGYVSPSGGFKFFIQIDERTREALNISEPPDSADSTDSAQPVNPKSISLLRHARHALVCKCIWEKVYDISGLTCDPACKDISRVQYFYHGELVERAKDTPQVFTVPSLASLVERATKETVAPAAEDDLLTERDPLPILISEFPKWLDDNGYAEQAEGFRAMRWEGNHMYGMCPACAHVCTGHRADRDLQFNIVRDFPSTSWFHCLHSSCQDKDRKVKSMNDLFRMYVRDVENRDVPVMVRPSGSTLLQRIYSPDDALKRILAENGPLQETAQYYEGNPERWATFDFPERDQKKNLVPVNPDNVRFLLTSLGLRVVRDVSNENSIVLDLVNRRLYPLTPEFVYHIATHWATYLSRGVTVSKLQHELDSVFQGLATTAFYHPLASVLCAKPWDGLDRIGQYIHSLELEEGKAPEGYTEKEWLDYVLRTWLYTVLDHMEKSMDNVNNMCPMFCPIFIGSQGDGKSSWASRLLSNYPGCFTGSFDIHNEKDAIVQKSSTLVIQLDEIDRLLSNPEDANKVKNAIDLLPSKTRAAYQREQRMYKPKAVFIGTSNNTSPLTDTTGNRRYAVLYVRSIDNDLTKAKAIRDSVDSQQLWAQVYENYHSLKAPIAERVQDVIEKTRELNDKFGMRESTYLAMVNDLRPVDWKHDTDTNGKPLWKRIPHTYTGPQALFRVLLTNSDPRNTMFTNVPNPLIKVTQQMYNGFKTAFLEVFKDPSLLEGKQISGSGARRMRFLHVEEWKEYASKATKERWYKKYPEWKEYDEDILL